MNFILSNKMTIVFIIFTPPKNELLLALPLSWQQKTQGIFLLLKHKYPRTSTVYTTKMMCPSLSVSKLGLPQQITTTVKWVACFIPSGSSL